MGAVVASAVTGGLILAFDDDAGAGTSSEPTAITVAAPSNGSNLELEGPPLDIQGVLSAVQPGVVSIDVEGSVPDQAGLPVPVSGAGSGMVIEEDGLVLTNAHVVGGATVIEVTLSDGSTHSADLVGSLPSQDVALVRIRDAVGLETVELGNSSELSVGDDVVAVGNALDLGGSLTVTSGIVSALNRSIQAENSERLTDLIQTDAAINPGNSGGPLVNAAGQVVGVNTAIAGGAENIGFALSIDSVKPLIEDVKSGGGEILPGAFLGVATDELANVNPAVLERLAIDIAVGAFVVGVESGSAAEAAGIQEGDVILAVDGVEVAAAVDLGEIIRDYEPGDAVEITVLREGEEQELRATLGSRGVSDDG